jgi:hypothetical protein
MEGGNMARRYLGILAGALVGLVCIVLAVAVLVLISLAGMIEVPKVVDSVLVCIAAAAAAYVAGRVGRTDGATLGVIAVLVVEAILFLFQRETSSVQLAVYSSDAGSLAEPKIWFGARIVIGMIMGAQGAYAWRRKAARLEGARLEEQPEVTIEKLAAAPPADGVDDDG